MPYSTFAWSLLALLFLVAASCRGTIDRRVDPDSPDAVGGANLQSQDIRTMADGMARDIKASGVLLSAPAGERISFYTTGMVNESSDPINTSMVTTMLRTELFKALGGRVQIIDRSAEGLDAVRREREAKRSGAVAGKASQQGNVLGSDYILKGRIQDRVLQSGRLKSAFYVVTFELTNLETSELMWTGDYQAKFESEKSVISR